MPPRQPVTVGHITKVPELTRRIKQLGKRAAYVGIPEATNKDRAAQLMKLANKIPKLTKKGKPKKSARRDKLLKAATGQISNASLLWIFSKGSELNHQPARPVLEPSIQAEGNREAIAAELAKVIQASLAGDEQAMTKALKRVSLAGQNAARSWFTDKRNGWAPNAQSTIDAKGSDRPGIDTGALRAAIVGVWEDSEWSNTLTKV